MSWIKLLRTKPTPFKLKYNIFNYSQIEKSKLLYLVPNIKKELEIRISHRIYDLDTLPYGFSNIPQIVNVKKLYIESFNTINNNKYSIIDSHELLNEFIYDIENIKNNHLTISKDIGTALQFNKNELTNTIKSHHINTILDKFYSSRIGIRTLITYLIDLNNGNNLVNYSCKPYNIINDSIIDAKNICMLTYGYSSDVELYLDNKFSFTYIDSHLYYIFFEILKNSMEANIKNNSDTPIKIYMSQGDDDIIFKVTDTGGGFCRHKLDDVFSYSYTTSMGGVNNNSTKLSGYGYGLPLSRVYARYFEGDLKLIPFEGHGTDTFIYLNRLGNGEENIIFG